MAIHVNRWYPDTCGCCIEFEWDDALPPDQREHIQRGVPVLCERHAAFSDRIGHLARIRVENLRKNRVINRILENHPALAEQLAWRFDNDHILRVDLPQLTRLQRIALRTWITANLPDADRVIIEEP
jgi:hypothetical protein